jgi:hypothetical protein
MRNKRIPAAALDAPRTRTRPRTQRSGPSPRAHCQQLRDQARCLQSRGSGMSAGPSWSARRCSVTWWRCRANPQASPASAMHRAETAAARSIVGRVSLQTSGGRGNAPGGAQASVKGAEESASSTGKTDKPWGRRKHGPRNSSALPHTRHAADTRDRVRQRRTALVDFA